MPIDLKTGLGALNEALFPSPGNSTTGKLKVFGGESFGFAAETEKKYTEFFYSTKANPSGYTVAKGMSNTPIPRAIANSYALFNFRGMYGGLNGAIDENYRDNSNNPLMGGRDAKKVSISKIIDFYDTIYPHLRYKASDFLYSKYYKKIPVNHLITLRRFALPSYDNVFDYKVQPGSKDPAGKTVPNTEDYTQVAGVTAITYIGETAGNKLEDILNYSFGLNWTEQTGEMKEYESGDPGYTGQPFYSKIGAIGRAAVDASKGISSGDKFRKQVAPGGDTLGTTYANFVIGPVNVVNKTTVRDRGLKFSNDFKLVFEYELRSLNYVNPKIAMIDIISNMLTMTTNNAQFFGGGHRYYGAGGYVASQFGDPAKLRAGDWPGYMGSLYKEINEGMKTLTGAAPGATGPDLSLKGVVTGFLNTGKNLLGNILGGFLSKEIGAVGGAQATQAFISGDPTGNWHVTVGNPLNPIAIMGNMYCDNATMVLGKGLGYDDFPMELKFEIDVKHAKPRDKGDIENMFNAGRGRIYASAADEKDINNLAGFDIKVAGAVAQQGLNVSLQPSQSDNGSPPSSVTNSAINTTAGSGTSGVAKQPTTQYLESLVSFTIDS